MLVIIIIMGATMCECHVSPSAEDKLRKVIFSEVDRYLAAAISH